MKILLAASEAVPFCKTGGLADVVGALALKLGDAGHEVVLFLPKYRGVEVHEGSSRSVSVSLGGQTLEVSLRLTRSRSFSVCFVDYPSFFDRPGLYGDHGQGYGDNDSRFILFSRAVLEGARAFGFKPDVIHAHDWQTGLIPAYLKNHYRDDPFFSSAVSVMTVHNMAYQGNFPSDSLALAGFGMEHFTADRMEYYGQVSFLKAGLVFGDALSTVSPAYALEIQESPERGFGLEGLLRHRASDLHGILNGIDLEVWNPATDEALAKKYSARTFKAGKAACKAALQARCGFAPRADIALFGVVSRFDYQKGLDTALEALMPRLGECQLAVLGAGDPALAHAFESLARERPQSVYLHSGFDEAFAHQIYAGSDLFLMPSRFEPCGLGQMIAMRYGSVPVAARTGGLADTVFEEPSAGRLANGFLCEPGSASDLAGAIGRALDAYGKPLWKERVRAGMTGDFSWDRSLELYLKLYRGVL